MRMIWAAGLLAAMTAGGCNTGSEAAKVRVLDDWVELGSTGAWSQEDGVIRCNGEKSGYAWLASRLKYRDFELTLEWQISPKGNSGIFLRAPSYKGRISMLGMEIQIRDDSQDDDLTDSSGAVFKRIPAAGQFSKPVGEWNDYKIVCRGRRLRIELNRQLVSDTDMDTVESMREIPDEGYIGLQNHGQPVAFRNIRIRPLN